MNVSPTELLLDLRQIPLASMGLYLTWRIAGNALSFLVERGYSIGIKLGSFSLRLVCAPISPWGVVIG